MSMLLLLLSNQGEDRNRSGVAVGVRTRQMSLAETAEQLQQNTVVADRKERPCSAATGMMAAPGQALTPDRASTEASDQGAPDRRCRHGDAAADDDTPACADATGAAGKGSPGRSVDSSPL
eukprot:CAMPEP_0177685632 /NCGR_PEP_ID=MMETSP0447-20121125/33137_1 /TAXON_ID=0 /ORGANISM="Stygamoeba regulata, Strain BSH-02190019" /LENGTH=120 /DNA_ID=CAMNT_0019195697 /DNA_START=145 /DNA_END=508 /DNA_ORIENTATION=-